MSRIATELPTGFTLDPIPGAGLPSDFTLDPLPNGELPQGFSLDPLPAASAPAPTNVQSGAPGRGAPLPAPVPVLVQPGNIDLANRPRVQNPDGSTSTVLSKSFNFDGQEVLIPTLVNGRIVSDQEAIDHYRRTGEHLGIFANAADATHFAQSLHEREAARITATPAPVIEPPNREIEIAIGRGQPSGGGPTPRAYGVLTAEIPGASEAIEAIASAPPIPAKPEDALRPTVLHSPSERSPAENAAYNLVYGNQAHFQGVDASNFEAYAGRLEDKEAAAGRPWSPELRVAVHDYARQLATGQATFPEAQRAGEPAWQAAQPSPLAPQREYGTFLNLVRAPGLGAASAVAGGVSGALDIAGAHDAATAMRETDARMTANLTPGSGPVAGYAADVLHSLGAVGGYALTSEVGGPAAVYGMFGATGYGTGYDDAKRLGANDTVAMISGLANAGVSIGTVPLLGKMLGPLNAKTGGAIARATRQAGYDGLMFTLMTALQTGGGHVIAKQLYDENRDLVDATIETAKGSAKSLVAGGVLGLIKFVALRGHVPPIARTQTTIRPDIIRRVNPPIPTAEVVAEAPTQDRAAIVRSFGREPRATVPETVSGEPTPAPTGRAGGPQSLIPGMEPAVEAEARAGLARAMRELYEENPDYMEGRFAGSPTEANLAPEAVGRWLQVRENYERLRTAYENAANGGNADLTEALRAQLDDVGRDLASRQPISPKLPAEQSAESAVPEVGANAPQVRSSEPAAPPRAETVPAPSGEVAPAAQAVSPARAETLPPASVQSEAGQRITKGMKGTYDHGGGNVLPATILGEVDVTEPPSGRYPQGRPYKAWEALDESTSRRFIMYGPERFKPPAAAPTPAPGPRGAVPATGEPQGTPAPSSFPIEALGTRTYEAIRRHYPEDSNRVARDMLELLSQEQTSFPHQWAKWGSGVFARLTATKGGETISVPEALSREKLSPDVVWDRTQNHLATADILVGQLRDAGYEISEPQGTPAAAPTPPAPAATGAVGFTARMESAATANEGRDIIHEHEAAVQALERSIGIAPNVGIGAQGPGSVGFSVIKPAEWRRVLRETKAKDPARAEELRQLIEDGRAMRPAWDALLEKEHATMWGQPARAEADAALAAPKPPEQPARAEGAPAEAKPAAEQAPEWTVTVTEPIVIGGRKKAEPVERYLTVHAATERRARQAVIESGVPENRITSVEATKPAAEAQGVQEAAAAILAMTPADRAKAVKAAMDRGELAASGSMTVAPTALVTRKGVQEGATVTGPEHEQATMTVLMPTDLPILEAVAATGKGPKVTLAEVEAGLRRIAAGETLTPVEAPKPKARFIMRKDGKGGTVSVIDTRTDTAVSTGQSLVQARKEAARLNKRFNQRVADEAELERLSKKMDDRLQGKGGGGVELRGMGLPLDAETLKMAGRIGYLYVKMGAQDFAAWSRKMLARFGETIRPHLRDIYERVRAMPESKPYANMLTGTDEVAMRVLEQWREPKPVQGRPDLAIPVTPKPAREAVKVVDQARTEQGLPERKPDTVRDLAAAEIMADPVREAALRAKMNAGEGLRDDETIAGKAIVDRAWAEAIRLKTPAAVSAAVRETDNWRRTGTEVGRSMRARRDEDQPPAVRARLTLHDMLFKPNEGFQRAIDSYEAVAHDKQQTDAKRKQAKARANGLRDAWGIKVRKVLDRLDKMGLGLDTLTDEQLHDTMTRNLVSREISTGTSQAGEMLYETWMSGIMSGIITQTRNTSGNTGRLILEGLLFRPIAKVLNLATGNRIAGAPRFGEGRYVRAAMGRAFGLALRDAWAAWRSESAAFESRILRTRSEAEEEVTKFDVGGRHAIPGRIGRILRGGIVGFTGPRGTVMMDEFFKSYIGNTQVQAIAYRAGKARGLTGDALDAFMAREVTDLGSNSWYGALADARRLTYQEPLHPFGRKMLQLRRQAHAWGTRDVWPGKPSTPRFLANLAASFTKAPFDPQYHVPFVTTLVNILKTGLAATPVGTPFFLGRLAQHAAARAAARQSPTTAADLAHFAAAQILGYATFGAIMAYGGRDDEDGLPRITGNTARTLSTAAERNLGYNTVPAQHIRIPGMNAYFDYSWIEPVATIVATNVDVAQAFSNDNPQQDIGDKARTLVTQTISSLKNKSFAQGLDNMVRAIDEEQGAAQFIQGWLSGFIPNIIRSTARSTDPYIRESSRQPTESPEAWAATQGKRLAYQALPVGSTAAPEPTGYQGPPRTRVEYDQQQAALMAPLVRMAYTAMPAGSIAPPPKVDIWGNVITKPGGDTPLAIAERIVVGNVVRTTDAMNQWTVLIRNWNDAHRGNGAFDKGRNPVGVYTPDSPQRKFVLGAVTVTLDDRAYYAYSRLAGQIAGQAAVTGWHPPGTFDLAHPTTNNIIFLQAVIEGGRAAAKGAIDWTKWPGVTVKTAPKAETGEQD